MVNLNESNRIPTLADAKANLKRLVEEEKLRLIDASIINDDKQFDDEEKLSETHSKTDTQIATERKVIRERQVVINAEIDALTTVDAVQAYKIEF